MGFLENILKLKEKENKIFLFLLIWFLIAFTVMQISIYLNYAIIGIFFYFPLLGFTLFLWFISFSNIKIREYSYPKLLLLILLEFLLVIVFVILTVIFMIVSIFSYVFFTSFFLYTVVIKWEKNSMSDYIIKSYHGFGEAWNFLED